MSDSNDLMIEVRDLRRTCGAVVALDGISQLCCSFQGIWRTLSGCSSAIDRPGERMV